MTSPYLTLPCRSFAQARADRDRRAALLDEQHAYRLVRDIADRLSGPIVRGRPRRLELWRSLTWLSGIYGGAS